ncbi:ATP-dependent DNA helicase [Trichonephila clavata]|uniref:ATP-dependent DNA helicase n=1 Tax=Trichonephila clavata TaxID=2740835 RepID=A0A8X6GQG1_TRICU|nr:ATP-dependent DNA helicase [Trichonephila clavata]
MILIGTRQCKRQLCLSHQHNSVPSLPFWFADVWRETCYDVQSLRVYIAANVPRLTPDQQQAFIASLKWSELKEDAWSFWINRWHRQDFSTQFAIGFCEERERHDCGCCASSSIAAALLAGGLTAHLAFKLPLDLARSDSATCNISKGRGQGHVLKTCKLIVWDEATMSHRNAFHAIGKTLQDLQGSSAIMGAATVLLAGDFPLSHVAHQQIRSMPV